MGKKFLFNLDYIPSIFRHFQTVREEVGKHYNMGDWEPLGSGFILCGEEVSILELFNKAVGECVLCTSSPIKDDDGLMGVSIVDISMFSTSDDKGSSRLEMESEVRLSDVSDSLPSPMELSGVGGRGQEGGEVRLPSWSWDKRWEVAKHIIGQLSCPHQVQKPWKLGHLV